MIENKIKRFIAWGHKLHSHTHSYIHNAFIIAFQHLGYPTLWLDNTDDVSEIDFEGSLFLTEGCVDANIPVRNDCYYILHNCNGTQFVDIPQDHIIVIQVFTKGIFDGRPITYIEPCIYREGRVLYMPWATDLLPYEINDSIRCLDTNTSKSILHFIGYGTEAWDKVKKYCTTHNITYHSVGGFIRYDDKLGYISTNVDVNDNITLIRESIVAPAVQNQWQTDNGYIPCRIFKNISYGRMGMTNNEYVYDLFDKKILFHKDIDQLMDIGLQFETNSHEYKKEKIIPLMEFVRDHHTYISRIKTIFNLFNTIAC